MIGGRIMAALAAGLVLLTMSCGPEGRGESNSLITYSPSSGAAVEELYESVRFEDPDRILLPGGSARFLKGIHGWLVAGVGLERRQIGAYGVLELRPIPERILSEIVSVTFDDAFDSGFLLLQARFWKEVARLQREQGLRIAVIDQGPAKIVGVAFEEPRLVAVSIVAESGTLRHELRHVTQYDLLEKHRAPLVSLSEGCLTRASGFFAELDATTIELPSWKKVFLDLPSAPASPSATENGTPKLPSVVLTFLWNLEYPDQAFGPIASGGCPDELVRAGREITESVDRFRSLADPRSGYNAASDIGILSAQAGPGRMTDGIRKAERLFSEAIDEESSRRPRKIRAILSRLSPGVQHDLCHGALGYELLADCSRYW